MKRRPESYLVRIYRREPKRGGITGMVEIITEEKTKAFSNAIELMEIMRIYPFLRTFRKR